MLEYKGYVGEVVYDDEAEFCTPGLLTVAFIQ